MKVERVAVRGISLGNAFHILVALTKNNTIETFQSKVMNCVGREEIQIEIRKGWCTADSIV